MKKVFIIGGGASGMIAALNLGNNYDIYLIERNSILGKKILSTGNGRCNYWNENQNISNYHSNSEIDLKKIINKENEDEVQRLFNSLSIIPKVKDGYFYPLSNQASSILNSLTSAVKRTKAKIICDELVVRIEKKDKFIIVTDKNTYQADKVIIATGGMANPKSGSDGAGIKMAASLGHHIIKPVPALVQLVTNNTKKLSGARCEVKLSSYENNRYIESSLGEIQFTDYGLSGICTMQLSSTIARGLLENRHECIRINLAPSLFPDCNACYSWLLNKKGSNQSISEILDNILNYKLTNYLLDKEKINNNQIVVDISNDKLKNLSKSITELEFIIIDTKGFDYAQTTNGGIDLAEVNLKTLESKICPGLFFCGEILDIDGKCGGYNLSFAWISGMLAGKGACNND